ncbi:MAG: hypothetical protein DRP71_12075 [Verrucomicrobia bacterium]|nr:MAG: hypothetical protein DRP71_12075 [Verrucomicrobiota bacterium]
MSTRNISRLFVISLLALATGLSSYAGDIIGRIKDANTDGYLPGVSVKIPGTNRTTTTDREGRYRVGNLAAGSYTVQAEYIGYDRVTKAISVPATGSVTNDITLGSEVVELEAYDVTGYREGRSLALQQKRTAGNVMDLVSADSVGSLPDRNVAEALARIPGISLDVDAGEGRFVSIRGIEPNFNTVTYNGVTLAPPSVVGREGRSMPLDVVGSSQVNQIEVIKSLTPDMDGNSLGGTINIKSASGYDREKRFIMGKLELGSNTVADGTLIDTDITYGDTFNDGKIGLALSANYSNRPYSSEELQMSWDDDDNGFFPTKFERNPKEGERERLGFNYNLEFRPDEVTEIYFFGFYNQFNDAYRQQEFLIHNRADPEWQSPTLINVDRMRFEQRDFRREIDQSMINSTLGMKKRFDNLTVRGDITYSFSKEEQPFIKSVQYRTGNLDYNGQDGNPPPFQYEFGGFFPAINDQGAYQSIDTPEVYPLRRFRVEDSTVEETTWTPRLDFTWDYEDVGGYPGTFQVGAKYTDRSRFVNDNSRRPVSADGFSHTVGDISPSTAGFPFFDGRYMYPSDMEVNTAFDYLAAHPDEFVIDPNESLSNSFEDDYDVTEKILGLYLMGTVDWSEQLHMIYGVRYEDTDTDLTAWEFQEGETGEGDVIRVVQNDSTFDYDNWMPNLQFRYDVTESSVLRFAATATIGRPQYEKASPISVLDFYELEEPLDPDFAFEGELEIGNPDLSPYESLNLDFAYEYYFKSGAMLSVGLFYKAIDNPIYEFQDEEDNILYNDVPMETLYTSSFRNADSATISGLELNAVLPFTTFFQGNFLDGFGVDANATFIDSSVDVIDREDEDLPFFRQPTTIYNLALYYQKYGFAFRVAYNYQDESLRELSGNEDSDYWDKERGFTDIQASYRVTENFTVYVNWRNVAETKKDTSYGPDTNRMRASEFYGSDIRGGIRFLF